LAAAGTAGPFFFTTAWRASRLPALARMAAYLGSVSFQKARKGEAMKTEE
jgi:hypothetical protein